MHRGYVKVWRKVEDSGLLQMPNTLALFMYLLLRCTHKPIKYAMETLQPGQFVCGRKKLSEELEQSEREIRTSLERLVTLEILTIKTTNRYSVYTIVNYEQYQKAEADSTSKTTNKRPTSDQQATTKQEHKNVNTKDIRDILLNDGVALDVADEFIHYRKTKNSALTPRAWKAIANQIKLSGWPVDDAICQLMQRGWVGFEAGWVTPKNNGSHEREWV